MVNGEMKQWENEEDRTSDEYFRKIQGEDRDDAGPERISSISPEEYRKREREHKRYLRQEDFKIRKTNEIMKLSFVYFFIGILSCGFSFLGIFWFLPYFSLQCNNQLFQILVFIPLAILGTAGIILTATGVVKFFTIKKIVEGSPDW